MIGAAITILMPEWAAQRSIVTAGPEVFLAFPVPRGQALWIQASPNGTLRFFTGGKSLSLFSPPFGSLPLRLIFKHDVERIGWASTGDATVFLWLEDQRTLEPGSQGPDR